MLLLALYHFLIFWIDGLIGHGYHRLGTAGCRCSPARCSGR